MSEHLSTGQDLARPRDGVSIAVFKDRSVLLVRRGRPPFAGLWSLPGGKIEEKESPREAAHRELREETGIEAHIEGILDTVFVAGGDARGGMAEHRLTVFYGRHAGGDLKAGDDAEAAKWTGLDEIERLEMTEGTAPLIWLAAHRLRRPLIG